MASLVPPNALPSGPVTARMLAGFALLVSPLLALASGFQGHHSGTWWSPERDGEGQFLSFEQVGERQVAVLAWFTYDESGSARWLVGSSDYRPGERELAIPLFSGRGARFGVGFRSEDVMLDDAGTARLDLVDCNAMVLHFGEGTDRLSLPITRLHGPLQGTDCDAQAPPAANPPRLAGSLSGSWWSPERNGEGGFLGFETKGDRHIATLFYFSYDTEGNPLWRVGAAEVDPAADRFEIALLSGAGARFGRNFEADDVIFKPAGRVRVEQDGCAATHLRFNGEVNFSLAWTRTVGELQGLPCTLPTAAASEQDEALRPLLAEHGLQGDPSRGLALPGIDAPLARLGKWLFFSRALSADGDAACASCHHPALGGADGLAVSVGTAAELPELVGPGRLPADGVLRVGRNANTFFNTGLLDRGLFWDSRVERHVEGGIATPDVPVGAADPAAGHSLLAAQARFPVLQPAEMLGQGFPGLAGDAVRDHLAARIGDYGSGRDSLPPSQWLARFRAAFGSDADAESLIRFDTIAAALAEYQRSAVFVDTPWARYLRGNLSAISEEAKAGALVFLRRIEQGGAQCTQCHRGDLFTDQMHHPIGFPQVGPGLEPSSGRDPGRGGRSDAPLDQLAFRTPSLLNVALTAPYGHTGSYATLARVIGHYRSPAGAVSNLMFSQGWCRLPPFDADPDCADGEAQARMLSREALDQLQRVREQDPERALPALPATLPFAAELQLAAFLETLTDPCLLDRSCYGRWIPDPDEAPDGLQLNAVDREGRPL